MAKNIFKVATEADYATMLNNGLPVPHIVLVDATGKYHVSGRFAHKENAAPGDIVCFDNGNPVFVKKNGWNDELIETLGAPQAIVVASYGVAEDGKVLCCAVDKLTDSLGGNVSSTWDKEGLYEFSGVMTKSDNIAHATLSSTQNGYLPSDIYTAEVCAEDTTLKYAVESGNRTRLTMSPYLTNGSVNDAFGESYVSPSIQKEELNVLVKGVTNIYDYSHVSDDGRTHYLPNSGLGAAHSYHTSDIAAGKWFLPSCYHLGLLVSRLGSVSDAFVKIGGKTAPVSNVELLSSQSNGAETIWTVNTENGLAELRTTIKDNERFDAIAFTLL